MEENWSIQLEDLREGRVREVELTRTLELDERMRGQAEKDTRCKVTIREKAGDWHRIRKDVAEE